MSEVPGPLVDLDIDRAVAGGRMLARHEGRVVLVAGAIPGERVRAKIERVDRHVTWARVVDVIAPSPDRRIPACDPACGGSLYAHVGYDRQRQLKSDVIADAFRRIGKMTLGAGVPVAASPERGYRLRARLHVRGRRAGFFLEGTHTLCEAGTTGQLHADAVPAASAVLDAIDHRRTDCDGLIISENIPATERVIHLEPREGATFDDLRLAIQDLPGVSGVTTLQRAETVTLAGDASVTDTSRTLLGSGFAAADAVWRRRAPSFFQANRFLAGALVRRVIECCDGESCVDLYSGVGLFAVALASIGRKVVAVEGDRMSGSDLRSNAAPWGSRLEVVAESVERFVRRASHRRAADVVVLDPPRTGVSVEAVEGLAAWRVPRLVYVSCDPPTLARDAARLLRLGYRLTSIDAFDLFPNTPHVEAVAVFQTEGPSP
jgi:23S rRNA (uracil1939-C5)-methyltransferase